MMRISTIIVIYRCVMTIVDGQVSTGNNAYSMCTTDSYRNLPVSSQNEHQCLLMEQFNSEFFSDREDRIRRYKELNVGLQDLNEKLDQLIYDIDDILVYGSKTDKKHKEEEEEISVTCNSTQLKTNKDMKVFYETCYDLKRTGGVRASGVYPLRMPKGDVVLAACDMDRGGGGWTIIQRRIDGTVNFTRNWTDYQYGFGNPNTEYWLGLEYIHQLSANTNTSLRVDLWDWQGRRARAEYRIFYVTSGDSNYTLIVDGFHGNAGDSLTYHHNMSFSTPDRDNDIFDGNCAEQDGAGWWYRGCSYTALNSKYHQREAVESEDQLDGIFWYHWKKSYTYPLPKVEIKIRPWTRKSFP